ncbi:unnamed protein product [Heligmosomoides polygyrus]|uniref:BRO1 domain-containing protein n=1 Tax=Heligmosomoides polygyrus TaxID=6339 RepID=A0A3P7WQM4_HELPZ|nr:unnamed protein product [Heligmosomoides polygyrus]
MTALFKGLSAASTSSADLTGPIEDFHRLRQRACSQPTAHLQTLMNSLAEYYDQLMAFEKKIEHSAARLEGFRWNDAFDNGKSFFGKAQNAVADMSLERAAVLFNYGAVLSQIAASQSFLSDDETKTAAKMFQQSAGVFVHLRDVVQLSTLKNLTTDLNPSTLATFSSIMLAQAQEAFYRKAYAGPVEALFGRYPRNYTRVFDPGVIQLDGMKVQSIYIKIMAYKMNPSALVKIAAQAGDLYSEASKSMDLSKNYWKKEWLNVVSGKAFGFQAIAELHQAQVHWERHEVGERLSRLKHAYEGLEKMKRRMPASCFREQVSEIENAQKAANSDNRLIYHERIPEHFTLPALPRANLAKPTPLSNPLYAGFKGSIVASLSVPDVLPEDVKRKSSKVKDAGGVKEMRKKLNELSSLQKQNSQLLVEIDRILVDENHSDADLRKQLQSDRVRISSDQVVGPFVEEISKHHTDLIQSSEVDKALKNLFDANEKAIDMLSRSEEINLKLTSSAAEDLTKNGNDFLQVDDDVYIQESVDKASVFCRCKPKGSSQRGQTLRSLDVAYDAFNEIRAKLDPKIKFYNEMITSLRRLRSKVKDFSFARQTEKEELLRGRKAAASSRGGAETKVAANATSAPSTFPQMASAATTTVPTVSAYPTQPYPTGAAPMTGMTAPVPMPPLPQLVYPQYPVYAATQPAPALAQPQPLYGYMPTTAPATTTSAPLYSTTQQQYPAQSYVGSSAPWPAQ